MLRTGAAGAARALLRRWLPGWAGGSPDRLAGLLTRRGGEEEREAAALWAEAVAGSSLCCCKELEPMVAEARSRLCGWLSESPVEAADTVLCEGEGEGGGEGGGGGGEGGGEGDVRGESDDDTGGRLAALAAAAALAVHGLTTGFCVPCTAEEAAGVADGSDRISRLDTAEQAGPSPDPHPDPTPNPNPNPNPNPSPSPSPSPSPNRPRMACGSCPASAAVQPPSCAAWASHGCRAW